MFTGIVDHCGKLLNQQKNESALRWTLETQWTDLVPGESISVDGACLTVNRLVAPSSFECDLSFETLGLTRAGDLKTGSIVNLERSLRPTDRMGGHWVTGHVDQRAVVTVKEVHSEYMLLKISDVWPEHRKHLLRKGCISVNGVSLTVNATEEDWFEVLLIPHTLERTNLRELEVGSPVNLELDWMSKMVLGRLEEWVENRMETGLEASWKN